MRAPAEMLERIAGHLRYAILRSERDRLRFIAAILAVNIVLLFFIFLSPRSFEGLSLVGFAEYWFLIIVLFTVYEWGAHLLLRRLVSQGGRGVRVVQYMNVFVETSLPTLAILFEANFLHPAYTLVSPSAFAYGVFIVLSALRLNPKLCFFSGIVAGVQHAGIVLYYAEIAARTGADPLSPVPVSHFVWDVVLSLMMFVLTGAAAGFVTVHVKRAVVEALQTAEQQHEIVRVFGQHVSPEVAEVLLGEGVEPKPVLCEIVVMFVDVRDFSDYADTHSPEEVMDYLNGLFHCMVEVIIQYHGVVNKFLGDGLMALFGAPVPDPNAARNAVIAGREILTCVAEHSAYGALPPTKLGIGIHAGEAMVGNVGTPNRREFTVIGEVVNVAYRIEQLNKEYGSRMLLSEAVRRAAPEETQRATPLPPVRVKGSEEPLQLYRFA